MDETAKRTQVVLDKFNKTVEDMAKVSATQKQHDLDIQIENLRQEVKDLRQAASAPGPAAPAAAPDATP